MTDLPGLDIHLFGPLRVHMDGVELDTERWKSKKALILFKILAKRIGVRYPKDVLIDALWHDDADVERASHNLHTVVYYLRRELEPDLKPYEPPKVLRHSSGVYWLESGPAVRVDVARFRELIGKAQSVQRHDPRAAFASYSEALELYTDDFLPENLYEDWAAGVREELREKYFAAVAAVAELADGSDADRAYAVGLCRRALQRDGLREELHRALIHLLAQQGMHGEAAEQYRRCERILRDEFDVAPSPQTRRAYERLEEKAAQAGTPFRRESGVAGAKGQRPSESIPPTDRDEGEDLSPRRVLIQMPAADVHGGELMRARLQEALEQAGLGVFDIKHVVVEAAVDLVASTSESGSGVDAADEPGAAETKPMQQPEPLPESEAAREPEAVQETELEAG